MKKYWYQNKLLVAVALLCGLTAAVLTSGVSLILQQIIDAAVSKNLALFRDLLIITAAYISILCLLSYAASVSAKYLTQKMIRRYRSDIFKGIMSHEPRAFHDKTTAEFISSLTNDIKLVEENHITALLLVYELVVMFIVTLVLLTVFSPLVTGILIFTMLLMLLIPAFLGKLLEKRQEAVSVRLSVFTEKLRDFFSGYDVIRSYNMAPHINDKFDEENKRETDVKFRAAKLFALNEGLSDTLSVLSTVVVIFVSAYLVLSDTITAGTLMALVQLSGTFMTPIILLMQNLPKIQSVKPVLNKLNDYANFVPEDLPGSGEPFFNTAIVFDNVKFSYNGRQPALNNVSLSFERGKKYALLGHSGCGKSTLIKLLTGYTGDYSGRILYDGQELRTLDVSRLCELSAVIHQNVYLFNTTIGDNIFLHQRFSSEQIAKALDDSGVSLFLNELPNGLNTPVGENGSLLSGGQRQRIALARALIRGSGLIILDEGTSAIDRATAFDIENSLLAQKDLTLITITHSCDPLLLNKYDKIFTMENGRLVKNQDF